MKTRGFELMWTQLYGKTRGLQLHKLIFPHKTRAFEIMRTTLHGKTRGFELSCILTSKTRGLELMWTY